MNFFLLQGNIISELGPKSFGKQGVLSNLNLANNEISIISVGAFEGLIQLTHLNLSSNKLSSVPNGAFFSKYRPFLEVAVTASERIPLVGTNRKNSGSSGRAKERKLI